MLHPAKLPAVTKADAIPAHILLVELRTRITTQPLHYRSGDEETAAKSVHQLFATIRNLLAEHPGAGAFGTAGLFLLNEVVRPFTTRWHRWMVDGRFSDERARRLFRVELRELQARLAGFELLLSLLIKGPVEQAEAEWQKIADTTPKANRVAQLGSTVTAGIGREVPFAVGNLPGNLGKFATAEEINKAEWEFIHRRRQALGLEDTSSKVQEELLDATGLGLSGGGIRSATFCLGIVQVLARKGMLTQFDYLSTVSGGGYLGSFLTAFLGTRESQVQPGPPFCGDEIQKSISDAFNPVDGHESAPVRHLRNNSRYLLNGGLWGRMRAMGFVASGIMTNLLLILPVPLFAALAVRGLLAAGFWGATWQESMAEARSWQAFIVFSACALALVIAWLGLPLVQNGTRGSAPGSGASKLRAAWESITLGVALITLLTAALLLLPGLFQAVDYARNVVAAWAPRLGRAGVGTAIATLGAVTPFVFGVLATRLKAGRGKRVAAALYTLSGPLFCFLVFLLVGRRVLDGTWSWLGVALVTGAFTLWGWLCVDINTFSPHGFYRNRLCECYLAIRWPDDDDTGILRGLIQRGIHGERAGEVARRTRVGTVRQLRLSQINGTGAAPYHLINTAVNLPASREPNLRGRDCDFYVFSRNYCGGPVCGYIQTKALEALDPHVDLGTVMAISGAAASANAGVKTLVQFRFLLALLNVRLGYWLRNPKSGPRGFWDVPGPSYLFYEMTGWMHEKRNYLNLSDGGHIENLALYELLRRRCKLIVIVDGGMEPGMECADLMLAQRYAEIDLGARLELDIADLALDESRRSRAYAVFGKIHYGARHGAGANDLGWLLYLKLACTGEEPGYVVDYRRQNPDFPHQTTGDQLYDEAQFEAYRRLGECAAESLFREEITAGRDVKVLRDWFEALANNLLPDNDPAFEPPA